jgi:hypothetical protein
MRRRRRPDYRDYSIAERPQTKNDCTVRAMHIASGMPYDMCYLAIALCGRRNNSGSRMSDWIRAYQKVGLCKPEHRFNRGDIIPDDNVIILTRGHIVAIKNGVHSDGMYAKPAKRILIAWRIV